nr:histidine kinase N-terminal 7TM domain-containing protein [uncultured Anaerobutyricum sp.]
MGLVIAALLCRIVGKVSPGYLFWGILRTLIYIGLYIGWGISIHKRVVQKAAKNTLIFISGLMIFWFIVRSIKYFFAMDVNVERYLWYSYYLPMLFIPQAAVQTAVLLGQPEEYILPKWLKFLYVPATLCFLLVLSNDFHQCVFSFAAGEVWTDKGYSYAWGYYIVLLWEVVCAVAAFALMVYKCRLSQRKKYLPVIGIGISILYAIIYASGAEWMQVIGGDITAALCLMFVCIFESCIYCGLIQTNTGYEELFEVCTMGAQITDRNYCVRYTSANAMELSEAVMREAEKGGVVVDKKTLIKNRPIQGGHILWQEDIEYIIMLLERMEENRKTIEESNCLEQENYQTKAKINMLREKNRLYDKLQTQTAGQIGLLNELLSRYEAEEDLVKSRRLLAKISVIGTYIKRYGNLIFIGERAEISDVAELGACLEESFSSLKLMGIECALTAPVGERIYVRDAVRIYSFFESIVEACVDSIQFIWVKIRPCGEELIVCMEVESEADLNVFFDKTEKGECEDGVWKFTFPVKKAGEK